MGFTSAGMAEEKLGGVAQPWNSSKCRNPIDSGAMRAVGECQLTLPKHAIIDVRPGQVLEIRHMIRCAFDCDLTWV
jgi:hypothetical protein